MSIKKKDIFLLADSVVDLRFIYEILKKKHNVTWVFYYKKNISQAKDLGVLDKNIIFLNNKNILFLVKKILQFPLNKIFGYSKINHEKELLRNIKKIDLKFKPDLWITDTAGILSKINTEKKKATFIHSVPYKKFFLNKNTLCYDYVFIPGDYHLNRILNFYHDKKKELRKKLIISPSPKIIPYIKQKNFFLKKSEFFKKYSLDNSRETVVLATTHNAFYNNRFLPKNFGSEAGALEELCQRITSNNLNLIIKLHHYHHHKFSDKKFSFIKNFKNIHIFKPNKNFDSLHSEEVFFHSDIVITDTSGVGPICCYLGKKMIFLEPDQPFDWHSSDIEKKMRPGFIIKNKEDIYKALAKYKTTPLLFDKDRKDFTNSIFKYYNDESLSIIDKVVDEILNK